MKNKKERSMRLVIAWARIEESDMDSVIPASSCDKKGKERFNSLNTGDYSNSKF